MSSVILYQIQIFITSELLKHENIETTHTGVFMFYFLLFYKPSADLNRVADYYN